MSIPIVTKLVSSAARAIKKPLTSLNGNVLVYLIVVILIFGVLGVTIVSLFTTATSSSATPNDARRAFYIAESGVRFATSRIKSDRFQQVFISEINTIAQYTLANGSSFTIDVFSPWFISTTGQRVADNNIFTLSVPNSGKIPDNPEYPVDSNEFPIPFGSNFWLVDWQNFRGNGGIYPQATYAEITGASATLGSSLLTITLDINHGLDVEAGDTVCLAVQPTDADASLTEGESIYITETEEARRFFPSRNGTIRIVTSDNQIGDYYYDTLVDRSGKLELTNLKPMQGTIFVPINGFSTDDWVVLSPTNYRVITTGTAGDVTSEIGHYLNKQVWIFPSLSYSIFLDDDWNPVVTNPSVGRIQLGTSEEEKQILLGESTPESKVEFGAIWYGGDKSIGGYTDRCQAGRCLFGKGIRAFFTLDYSGDGEGIVFTLINGADNTSSSAGGDAERSELLGYAGDSRLDKEGTLNNFLDGTLNGDGLLPPKMGIEFDTRTNFDGNFEQTLQYCTDATTLRENTRNDPLPGGNPQDAVQHVFWGRETIVSDPFISCRIDDATYDDNKHDAENIFEKWQFNTGNNVRSSPAVDPDGTVYFGSDSNRVYALNPADRLAGETFPTAKEWEFDTGGNVKSSPAIGADDTIYIGSDSNRVYAFNPTERLEGFLFPSTNEWEFPTGSYVQSSPAIGSDGTIYIGDDAGAFFALSPAGVKKWEFTDPDLRKTSRGRAAIGPALDVDPTGNRQRIYITSRENTDKFLYALDPEDRQRDYDFNDRPFPHAPNEWKFELGDGNEFMPGVDDRPLPSGTGIVYTDETGNELRAVGPDSEFNVAKNYNEGKSKWVRSVGTDIDSTPAVGTDGTIYFGGDSGHLFALNPDSTIKWRFPASGSIGAVRTSPAIGPDGTIYFGSDDSELYAVGYDGTSAVQKFSFDTGGAVNSSPTIDPRDETVYVGSDSGFLHAINQLAEPRNFRDDSIEDEKLVSSADFPEVSFANSNNWLQGPNDGGAPDGLDGTWAVRTEVTYDVRIGDQPPYQYQYTLKTWIEKCNDAGCSTFLSSPFRNTLTSYTDSLPKLKQIIILSQNEHDKFEWFLFGFTSAAATGDTQAAIIKFFELSFIQ